ncbi:MAG: hypothetical protein L0213_06510, partial [Candidatus Dadabacteria bacterium]|nr:hypothetical protein [Candidatus Dadabacteria bacterium]
FERYSVEGYPIQVMLIDNDGVEHIIKGIIDINILIQSIQALITVYRLPMNPYITIRVPLQHASGLHMKISWSGGQNIIINLYAPKYTIPSYTNYLKINNKKILHIVKKIEDLEPTNKKRLMKMNYNWLANWLQGKSPEYSWRSSHNEKVKKNIKFIIEIEPSTIIIPIKDYFKAICDYIYEIKTQLPSSVKKDNYIEVQRLMEIKRLIKSIK